MRITFIPSSILATALFYSISSAAARDPYLTGIGQLPDYDWSNCDRVSHDGRVVVGNSVAGFFLSYGVIWREEEGLQVPHPWNQLSNPTIRAISGDGLVVVGVASNQNDRGEAYRWTAETGLVGLGDLPGGSFNSDAYAVSADGSVVVGVSDTIPGGTTLDAYRWTAEEGMVPLGKLPGGDPFSTAHDISDDGALIVGQSGAEAGHQAVIWHAPGVIEALGDFPGGSNESGAHRVSGDGQVIFGWGDDEVGLAPFRWTRAGGMAPLHRVLTTRATYFIGGANRDGTRLVGAMNLLDLGTFEPFIWDAQHGMRYLNDVIAEIGLPTSCWRLEKAADVSADGRTIVGGGVNPDGSYEGWVAYLGEIPPPCPGDTDEDGVLGLSDLGHLLEHFGETFNASPADGDMDLDTDIDVDDLALLLSKFGAICPAE